MGWGCWWGWACGGGGGVVVVVWWWWCGGGGGVGVLVWEEGWGWGLVRVGGFVGGGGW